jgi:aminocarboxymuconate-semialdehyde decarboxylase
MPVIDVHAHMFPQSGIKAWKEGREWFGATIEKGETGPATIRQGKLETKYSRTEFWVPYRERIPFMDRNGIDVQTLSLNPQMIRDEWEPKSTIEFSKSVNDELSEAVAENPDRFEGLANLPLQDTDASVRELNRVMTELGLKGFLVASHVGGRRWDDPGLFPVLEEAERTGAFILIHPFNNRVANMGLMPRYHLINLIGNPMETTVAAASLILGGVMDRLPKLKVCLSHAGGYLPFAAGRFDHAFGKREDVSDRATRLPSDYLRAFYYDCISHSDPGLEFVIEQVGVDRILVGTDFPADMGLEKPAEWLAGLAFLTAADRAKIESENALKLGFGQRFLGQQSKRTAVAS